MGAGAPGRFNRASSDSSDRSDPSFAEERTSLQRRGPAPQSPAQESWGGRVLGRDGSATPKVLAKSVRLGRSVAQEACFTAWLTAWCTSLSRVNLTSDLVGCTFTSTMSGAISTKTAAIG